MLTQDNYERYIHYKNHINNQNINLNIKKCNIKFENVDNGIMIDCYPTDFEYFPALFKLIKGF